MTTVVSFHLFIQFERSLEKFKSKWDALKPADDAMSSRATAVKAIKVIKEQSAAFEQLMAEFESIGVDCDHFQLARPDIPLIAELQQELGGSRGLWELFDQFSEALSKVAEEEWITFRSHIYDFDEFLDQWLAKLKESETNVVTIRIRKDVDRFVEFSPLLKYLQGNDYTPSHWAELFLLLGIEPSRAVESIKLEDFVSLADVIVDRADAIRDLNSRAQGEVSIRQALAELEKWGASEKFALSEFTTVTNQRVVLIKDWAEVIGQIGDHRSLLQSLRGSPFYPAFEGQATDWENKLGTLDAVTALLQTVQRKWVYLEPIFGRGALPKEQARFNSINTDFLRVMAQVDRDGRVLTLAKDSGLTASLETMEDQLTRCQKALAEFLEEKRSGFPRFYFIGDEDLLEILGRATDPNVIQRHLKKLFGGIHRVGFNEDRTAVVEIESQLGEIVHLEKAVAIHDKVEGWLNDLTVEMKASLRKLLRRCVEASANGEAANPGMYPSQILCLAEQVNFTRRCEKAVESNELGLLNAELISQLQAYTAEEILPVDTESIVLSAKLKTLITDIIHMIQVVEELTVAGTRSTQDWAWQKQLRYYLDSTDGCIVQMCDARFDYTFEYQGNKNKLVYTPLTDKCYLNMTQGMNQGYGGNPYGPAGTGKTESVKALGNDMGRQVSWEMGCTVLLLYQRSTRSW